MPKNTREAMLRENRIIIALLGIITAIAIGFVLYNVRSIVLPFALAVFISYILNPLIDFFEDRHVPKFLSIILALFITFLLFNLVGLLIYTSIKSFTVEFPRYEARFNMFLNHFMQFFNIPPEIFKSEMNVQGKLNWLESLQGLSLQKVILNTMGSILNFLSNTFLVLLFLLFILIGRKQITVKLHTAFEPETALKISGIINNINRQIQKYLLAKTLISLVTGFLFFIILLLFDVQFAMIWGILAFLLNFIPNVGSIIATFLPLSVAFLQFESISTLLWLALLLIGIQFVIGNLLDPRIVGSSLNLSPLVVLFSLIFWGWLWGIIGMFLAVPIMVIIKIVFENIEGLRPIGVMMSAR